MGTSSSSQRRQERRERRQERRQGRNSSTEGPQGQRPALPPTPPVPPPPNGAAPGPQGSQPYYLMVGGPPVHYRYNPGGPMIFYVDRQQPPAPAPEVQESVKIKNHANLLKHTLELNPTNHPTKYTVGFRCDTLVETDVSIYLATTEKLGQDPGSTPGAVFVTEVVGVPAIPLMKIGAATDYTFKSSPTHPVDVEALGPHLRYNTNKPAQFPVVVALSYKVPSEDASCEGNASQSKTQSQYTYAEVVKSPDDNAYQLRCIKQRLQLGDGSLFDLEDVYGVTGEGHHETAVVDTSIAEVDMEGDECVICMANERDTTVMPCRHMCLCADCAEVLRKQTNKCPICRSVIERLMTFKK